MTGLRSQLSQFEIEEFFRSLQTLLSSSFNSNISYDSAEYLSRRLDVYERNINILLARLIESYPLEKLLSDMHTFQAIIRRQRERCEALSFRSFLEEDHGGVVQTSVGARVTISGVGGPRLDVSQQVIETPNSQVGLSWAEIARNLGVSESTIRRRRRSFVSANGNVESHSTVLLVRGIFISYRPSAWVIRQNINPK